MEEKNVDTDSECEANLSSVGLRLVSPGNAGPTQVALQQLRGTHRGTWSKDSRRLRRFKTGEAQCVFLALADDRIRAILFS